VNAKCSLCFWRFSAFFVQVLILIGCQKSNYSAFYAKLSRIRLPKPLKDCSESLVKTWCLLASADSKVFAAVKCRRVQAGVIFFIFYFPSKHSAKPTCRLLWACDRLGWAGGRVLTFTLRFWGFLNRNINQSEMFGVLNFVFLPLLKYFSWDPFLKQLIGSNKSNGQYFQVCGCQNKSEARTWPRQSFATPFGLQVKRCRICRVRGL